MRVEALEDQLGKLSGQRSRELEARPRRCRAADALLLHILCDINKLQGTKDCTEDRKKSLVKRLNELLDVIDNKVEEA